jgi:triphosphoribosyl-dephospho-CoA synthase
MHNIQKEAPPLRQDPQGTAKHISSCLQLAVLLEISACKPGNVNRTTGFHSTQYEHFLASAVAVEPHFAHAAGQGILVSEGKTEPSEIGIGAIVKRAVESMNAWQHGGNTLLGTIILLSPMAAAAGITLADEKELLLPKLRANVKSVMESTTPADAVAMYEAINLANPNGLIGKAPTLDVNDPKSKERIVKERITLYDILRISATYDSISRELVENYPLTFDVAYPYFTTQLERTGSLDTAIVHTYLKILSTNPDTLIARKVGLSKAREVSERAREVLEFGGLDTDVGSNAVDALDESLRKQGNQLNPGTTADIIASVLAVSILNGYRP